jgi:hypothetical protein
MHWINERKNARCNRVLLIQDNVPLHMSQKTIAAKRDCGFQKLNQPHHSPDLNPRDYFIFWNLTKYLCAHQFSCENELKLLLHSRLRNAAKVSVFQGFLLRPWHGGSVLNPRETNKRGGGDICSTSTTSWLGRLYRVIHMEDIQN